MRESIASIDFQQMFYPVTLPREVHAGDQITRRYAEISDEVHEDECVAVVEVVVEGED